MTSLMHRLGTCSTTYVTGPRTMCISGGLCLPAPLFADPFQALERLAS